MTVPMLQENPVRIDPALQLYCSPNRIICNCVDVHG